MAVTAAGKAGVFIAVVFALTWGLMAATGHGEASPGWASPLAMFIPALVAFGVQATMRGGAPQSPGWLRWRPRRWSRLFVVWLAALVIVPVLLAVLAMFDAEAIRTATERSAGLARIALPETLGATQRLVLAAVLELGVGAVLMLPLFLGEEIGWRGFLGPALAARFGRAGYVASGAVWGLWHAPMVLWLGLNYPGTPAAGIAMMVVFCVPLGLVLQATYEWTGSILAPALVHGVLNKAAALSVVVLFQPDRVDWLWTGPAGLLMAGLLAPLAWFGWRTLGARGSGFQPAPSAA